MRIEITPLSPFLAEAPAALHGAEASTLFREERDDVEIEVQNHCFDVVSLGLLATAAYAVWDAPWVHPCTEPFCRPDVLLRRELSM